MIKEVPHPTLECVGCVFMVSFNVLKKNVVPYTILLSTLK